MEGEKNQMTLVVKGNIRLKDQTHMRVEEMTTDQQKDIKTQVIEKIIKIGSKTRTTGDLIMDGRRMEGEKNQMTLVVKGNIRLEDQTHTRVEEM